MKNIFLFSGIFSAFCLHAQLNLTPQPIPPLILDQNSFYSNTSNVIQNMNDIVAPAPNTTVVVPTTTITTLTSNTRIHLGPGFSVPQNSQYFFRALIANTDMDLAVFNPVQPPMQTEMIAYQNEKFELGLHLPQNLFDDVEGFCNNSPSYATPVNPYNPEDLNVYAEFTQLFPNSTGQLVAKVYGFYYREFQLHAPAHDECSNFTEWIRTFWTVPFSGCAGGLNWPKTSLPDANISYYSHFARLRDYLAGTDFNDGDWEPDYQLRNDYYAETIHLKFFPQGSPHADRAIGVVLSRFYNAWNMRTSNTGDCVDYSDQGGDYWNYPNTSLYDPPQDVYFNNGPGIKLKVTTMEPLHHYTIEWMDVMTGNTIETDNKYSQLDGDLVLEYPALVVTATPIRPILAFKIYPYGSTFVRTSSAQILETTSADASAISENSAGEFKVYPIPAQNTIIVTPECASCNYNIQIANLSGEVVFSEQKKNGTQSIDVSSLASGVYFVTLTAGEMIERKKIIIEK
ncbi:MAG: T9SS type A sorting domain-containing protein [Bacteroidetes bacterium]|nr:T9SS type A sorting domain-containing protein [Bacteroidota bacterium]